MLEGNLLIVTTVACLDLPIFLVLWPAMKTGG